MVSFMDMLALWIAVGIPAVTGMLVAKHYGLWAGVIAGLAAAIVCAACVLLFYRDRWHRMAQRRREWEKKYSGIYRVLVLPNASAIIKKPQDAEIKIGDYGWEAIPLRNDGLIYLQGLTSKWRVVWYAGFRPEQVEKITVKPRSQYDWDQTWVKNPPPCPFSILERETTSMGFPLPR